MMKENPLASNHGYWTGKLYLSIKLSNPIF